MGFLDNLLKKEARKIISGVMDSVVDNVLDGAKGAVNQSGLGNAVQKTMQPSMNRATQAVEIIGDESSCMGEASVVKERIEKCLAKDFAGCTIRDAIPSAEIGVADLGWTYTYGIYRDEQPVAMINLLVGKNEYGRKAVLQSKDACRNAGIGYVHFLMHMPNRMEYISTKLKQIISA